ncbi:MAG: glutamate-5-semialdehyde dehydrogenase [Planctomycetota bacterium]|nr:MAG: glutamate-5-semialdehyde dehydrogenase [Planctomycetota bacterium]
MDTKTLAQAARSAAVQLAALPTQTKNAVLRDLAERIESQRDAIAQANQRDLVAARRAGIGEAKLRRLTLSLDGVAQMAAGLRQIAELPDPVGAVTKDVVVPSGLRVRKVRCPIGVIMMIYEARPNVTIDAFALCFKAGNACILKGGREAAHSNRLLVELAIASLSAHGAPSEAIALLTTSDRDEIKRLLSLDEYIDLVIPRGGAQLIRFVHEHSRIPTVQHFHGVCHIYVDAAADVKQAIQICTTAKTSAPATFNAAECLLVHESLAPRLLPELGRRLADEGVEIRGDERVCELCPQAMPANDDDWGREFLDLILAIKVVSDVDEAIAHIQRHASGHTEAILTRDESTADEFVRRVQSSCVLVNASTRFNDGFQLGLGAEIGISTCKIHAYGPMGLEELTAQRYVVVGDGQVR